MSKVLKTILFCVATLASMQGYTSLADNQAIKDQMIGDLDFIKNTFHVMYAPAAWKCKYAGWELGKEYQAAKEKIQNSQNITTKEYQRIVRDFLKSTQDYHVGVRFHSTEAASLPFRVKEADGRYFFSYIDKDRLSPSVYKLNIGDELVMFDGRPMQEVIDGLIDQEQRQANEKTDRALAAEVFLTFRSGARGHQVPKGPITITVKPVHASKLCSYQLLWNYTPEKIKYKALENDVAQNKAFQVWQDFMMVPFFVNLDEEMSEKDLLGARKSYVPDLGNILWKTEDENPFHAYLYKAPDGRAIGYVRIPHYVGNPPKQVEEFAKIMIYFEEHADALVIDQVNNPGGSAFYLYALASMLTDQPLQTPKERMTITQIHVELAVDGIPVLESVKNDSDAQNILGPTIAGYPVTHQTAQFFLHYLRFIVDEWNAGRTFTEPSHLGGVDHINPYPHARFTKPILLLINSLDFSGGDFFPAILQDNDRATIFGTRTAGAGGYVLSTVFPNQFGIANIRYTGSLAERVDKNPIENLGVTPDIPYEITVEDLQSNYQGYVQAIHQAVHDLLQ